MASLPAPDNTNPCATSILFGIIFVVITVLLSALLIVLLTVLPTVFRLIRLCRSNAL